MLPTLQSTREKFDERGVSPVIGVILMVAITVILAAVIAFFVLGIGQGQEVTPNAAFDFDQTRSPIANTSNSGAKETPGITRVTVSHVSGTAVDTANVKMQVGATLAFGRSTSKYVAADTDPYWHPASPQWNAEINTDEQIGSGDEMYVEAYGPGDLWQTPNCDPVTELTSDEFDDIARMTFDNDNEVIVDDDGGSTLGSCTSGDSYDENGILLQEGATISVLWQSTNSDQETTLGRYTVN